MQKLNRKWRIERMKEQIMELETRRIRDERWVDYIEIKQKMDMDLPKWWGKKG